MSFGALAMLYASHVIQGYRTIESVPEVIRPEVEEIIEDAKGKKLEN